MIVQNTPSSANVPFSNEEIRFFNSKSSNDQINESIMVVEEGRKEGEERGKGGEKRGKRKREEGRRKREEGRRKREQGARE